MRSLKEEIVTPSPAESSALPRAGQLATWLPLLRDALNRDGQFRFPLRGTSMRPTLPESCEIFIVPLPERPPLGSLLVFAQNDTLIAHRLVRYTKTGWITQGDGRRGPDVPLQPAQALGVVTAASCEGRVIWPGRLSAGIAWFWIARHYVFRPPRALLHWLRRRRG